MSENTNTEQNYTDAELAELEALQAEDNAEPTESAEPDTVPVEDADEDDEVENEQAESTANADHLVTAYAAAGIVNTFLKEDGYETELAPQQFYGYMKRGQIPSVEVDGKKRIRLGDLAAWYKRFSSGQTSTSIVATEDLTNQVRELLGR